MSTANHRPIVYFVIAGLLCASLTLNVFTYSRIRRLQAPAQSNAHSYYSVTPADIALAATVPQLPLTVQPATLKFVFGEHYNITKPEEWASLIPPHDGRVRLGEGAEFGVGMYQDMRCLDVIRAAFVRMRDTGSTERDERAEACFGHIRQAIACTADITLEPAKVKCSKDEETGKVVCPVISAVATGNRVDHRCRDWNQVRAFVEENQKSWV
ncbi:hypothetical protein MIND_01112400 [Mycena indigotica]|uniref:Uncharacterized protein n=1 Tax=Mycena indigotica TaxID=2126181 RepID=A0A8H6W1A2_9AGAR|nr:uncharacterized protein MIND_01112400 [Mycena indigotica]KAF7295719.1 hypothetical protein MIND_01112400 [Mycena indigotica]